MAERGRPRQFDRAAALRAAMHLFWEHGYEGTSISDLTTAMGINAPSLYAAFGGKEALFHEAVAHYRDTVGSMTDRALREAPTAREAIEASLRGNAELYVKADQPGGCMIVLSAANYSAKNGDVHHYLAGKRRQTVADFEARLRRAQAEGELPSGADPAAIAAFYGAVLHGMAIEARDGVSHDRLAGIVESAMAAWPAVTATEAAPAAARSPR